MILLRKWDIFLLKITLKTLCRDFKKKINIKKKTEQEVAVR